MPLVVKGPLHIKDRAWDREIASIRSEIGRYASVHHLAVVVEDTYDENGCMSVEITFDPERIFPDGKPRPGLCVSQLPYFIEKLDSLGYALRTATLTKEASDSKAPVDGGVRFMFDRRVPKSWIEHE
jgi:hypothetical protein